MLILHVHSQSLPRLKHRAVYNQNPGGRKHQPHIRTFARTLSLPFTRTELTMPYHCFCFFEPHSTLTLGPPWAPPRPRSSVKKPPPVTLASSTLTERARSALSDGFYWGCLAPLKIQPQCNDIFLSNLNDKYDIGSHFLMDIHLATASAGE